MVISAAIAVLALRLSASSPTFLMVRFLSTSCCSEVGIAVLHLVSQCPYARSGGIDGLRAPRSALLKVADEHLVQTHGICAVIVNDLVRLTTLPRLLDISRSRRGSCRGWCALHTAPWSALRRCHTGTYARKRLYSRCSVVCSIAAVVPINRRPVFQCFRRGKRLVVVRVHIAQEVTRRNRPHGMVSVSLAGPPQHGQVVFTSRSCAPAETRRCRSAHSWLRSAAQAAADPPAEPHSRTLSHLTIGIASAPVTQWEYTQSRSFNCTLARAMPFSPSHSIITAGIASLTVLPFRKSEFTRIPVSSLRERSLHGHPHRKQPR